MKLNNITKVHWSFWFISLFGLLWNLGGCINYIMQMNLEFVATLPESHQAIIIDRPLWATVGFALGVFAGVIGGLLLMFRNSLAKHSFMVSLIGIITTMVHTVNVARSKVDFSSGEIIIMIILPIMVAMLLLWYSNIIINKQLLS